MIDWLLKFFHLHHSPTDLLALLLYYVPASINLIVYTVRVYYHIQRDKEALANGGKNTAGWGYGDWLRMRNVIGYVLLVTVPTVNLIAFLFDALGDIWKWMHKRFKKFFDFRFIGRDTNA